MARTPSNMLPLGTAAADFSLPDVVSGESKSLAQISGEKGTLLMFICNHCPFVIHVLPELKRLADDYLAQGIRIAAISSNDAEHYPQDGPEKMAALARQEGFAFPYLYDASQNVAKAYDAACTPDFYLFDAAGALAYRGQLDAARPGNDAPLDGADLRIAMDALLAGQPPVAEQKPSLGCNIKWKDS